MASSSFNVGGITCRWTLMLILSTLACDLRGQPTGLRGRQTGLRGRQTGWWGEGDDRPLNSWL